MSEIKMLAELVPAEGCERRVCPRPLSLAFRCLSSCSQVIFLYSCLSPHASFSLGYQSYWSRAYPNDLVFT